MAVKPFKEVPGQGYLLVIWEGLQDGDEGQPHGILSVDGIGSFRTFHVAGEFGGGAVQILGSIIPGEFDLMSGGSGSLGNLVFDTKDLKSTFDCVLQVKPKVVDGGPDTKVMIGMTVRKG